MYPTGFVWFIVAHVLCQWSHCSPIVGGRVVPNEDFPRYSYIVSLQDRLESENGTVTFKHFCGGSLITSSWILTAGHCVYKKKTSKTVAAIGYDYLKAVSVDHLEVDAVRTFHFNPSSLRNDIALVRLKSPVVVDEYGSLGRIPSFGMKASRKKACKVVGYGADTYGGETQDNLKEAEVYVISREKCTKVLGKIMSPQEGDPSVCALGDLQDSCQGDSGGPLICSYGGVDYIFGIVSHGLTCGQPGVPSIYTVTIPYKRWIDVTTQ